MYKLLYRPIFSLLWDWYLEMELLSHKVTLWLKLWEQPNNSVLFLKLYTQTIVYDPATNIITNSNNMFYRDLQKTVHYTTAFNIRQFSIM